MQGDNHACGGPQTGLRPKLMISDHTADDLVQQRLLQGSAVAGHTVNAADAENAYSHPLLDLDSMVIGIILYARKRF